MFDMSRWIRVHHCKRI